MNIVSVSPANGETVLTLEQAKRHLKIDDDPGYDDPDVAAFRDAAVDWLEQYTGRSFQRRTFRWSDASFARAAFLPIRPLRSIVSVSYLIADEITPVSTSDYRISGDGIVARSASPWPLTGGGLDSVRVEFEAGYDGDMPLPAALLAAVKMLMAHLYRNREAASVGVAVSEVPFGVASLCRPYRSWALV